jgi:tetratricopeptide (TPR) repeat protein
MFCRLRFRPIQPVLLSDVLPAVRHAHELMSVGRFEEAARSYEQLAHSAQSRGLPKDTHYFLVAGHCRIQAKQIDQAMVDLKQGLRILSERWRNYKYFRVCQRSIEELTNAGYKQEADEIQLLLKSSIGQIPMDQPPDQAVKSRNLPAVCQSCGVSLLSDEVDWVDDSTAKSPYCGTAIKISAQNQ